ncbi:LysR family transcriptional regulator [Paracoccus zhejiangensis]|uniref:HTH lysR-type domain-containing protein n=1 Tax=Paracoccus zhejiangensis TaxID=1077935 RepID=A0A2H5EWT8_9RHOB|nr:LysR family transcriptional regulator [Paracoccus zhejiangensis]AUH63757.1 hypothetical protein CX676_05960 [Paracoccus zhejiangensis]
MYKEPAAPNWDDLLLVRAIADSRGMPGAAAEFRISASTVFRRLGQIEALLGVALFHRHRSGYELTPAGADIVALAQRLEVDIAASLRRVAERQELLAGELSIVVDETLPPLLVPSFAEFLRQFPDFCLHVTTVDRAPDLSAHDATIMIFANGEPSG